MSLEMATSPFVRFTYSDLAVVHLPPSSKRHPIIGNYFRLFIPLATAIPLEVGRSYYCIQQLRALPNALQKRIHLDAITRQFQLMVH